MSSCALIHPAIRPVRNPIQARSEPEALRKGFCFAAVLLALVVCFVPAVFGTIDDFEMIRIFKGLDGFPADSDGLCLPRTLSECLFALYQWFPDVPWYGALLYLSTFLGAGLCLSVAFMPCADAGRSMRFMPAAVALVLHCLWYPTFTASMLLLLVGVFLHLMARFVTGQPGRSRGLLLTACLVLAYLWRWKLMLMFLILGLPLLLYVTRKDVRKALPYGLLFLLVVVFDRSWDHLATNTPEYQQYRKFAEWRTRFHDSPDGLAGPTTPMALRAAGWTKEDYVLFRSRWGIFDNQVFNAESVQSFLGENSKNGAGQYLRQASKCVLYGLYENILILPVFLFTLAALLLQRPATPPRTSPSKRIRAALLLGAIAAPLILLTPYRFVARVTVPLMLCLLGALTLIHGNSENGTAQEEERGKRTGFSLRQALGGIAFACALLACLWQCLIQLMSLDQQTRETQHAQQCLQRVQQTAGEPYLFVRLDALGTGLGYNRVHPLWGASHRNPVPTLTGIWKTMSPRYVRILAQLGCRDGREFLRRCIQDDRILWTTYFHSPSDQLTIDLWESYFNRRLRDAGGRPGPLRLYPVFDFRSPDGIGPVYYRVAAGRPPASREASSMADL